MPSAVDLRCDPWKRRVTGSTTNVSGLRLDFPSLSPGTNVTVELDGQRLESIPLPHAQAGGGGRRSSPPPSPTLYFAQTGGRWQVSEAPASSLKRPERSGPFREAFRRRFAFVYGTLGTPEENAWTLAKARFDAETFYYRGNGAVELMADVEVSAEKPAKPDENAPRNLILYGNADCNAAWRSLLLHDPVQVHRGEVRLGQREMKGEDLGCLFLRPHPSDAQALVGCVGGSGPAGGCESPSECPSSSRGRDSPIAWSSGRNCPSRGSTECGRPASSVRTGEWTRVNSPGASSLGTDCDPGLPGGPQG